MNTIFCPCIVKRPKKCFQHLVKLRQKSTKNIFDEYFLRQKTYFKWLWQMASSLYSSHMCENLLNLIIKNTKENIYRGNKRDFKEFHKKPISSWDTTSSLVKYCIKYSEPPPHPDRKEKSWDQNLMY